MNTLAVKEEPLDITDALKRRVIWDTTPCYRISEFLDIHDLIPGSEEGHEVEHQISHRRLNQLAPIAQPLGVLGLVSGDVVSKSLIDDEGEFDEDDFEYDHRIHQITKAVIAGSNAIIANLIDMGYLIVNPNGSMDL